LAVLFEQEITFELFCKVARLPTVAGADKNVCVIQNVGVNEDNGKD
jgi:hypothetical protein